MVDFFSKIGKSESSGKSNQLPDDSFRQKSKAEPRHAFRLSTVSGNVSFYLWVNPSECSWRIPLRTTIESIQGGAVHHEWDSIGLGEQQPQKYDQPVINFTFQSGNLLPYGNLDVDNALDNRSQSSYDKFANPSSDMTAQGPVPPGLGNFYDFLNLLNQPNSVASSDPAAGSSAVPGQANYVIIDYYSMIFPYIRLKGFFTQEGVQWNDSADNPLNISSWGASFVVFSSTPSLFDRGGLNSKYQSVFGNLG